MESYCRRAGGRHFFWSAWRHFESGRVEGAIVRPGAEKEKGPAAALGPITRGGEYMGSSTRGRRSRNRAEDAAPLIFWPPPISLRGVLKLGRFAIYFITFAPEVIGYACPEIGGIGSMFLARGIRMLFLHVPKIDRAERQVNRQLPSTYDALRRGCRIYRLLVACHLGGFRIAGALLVDVLSLFMDWRYRAVRAV